MKNFWQKLNRPILALAPMAGWTDSPTRQIAKEFGADLVYSEMISSDGVYYEVQNKSKNAKSLKLAAFSLVERPIVLQIFGNEPEKMAFAAYYLEKNYQPDGIDINMGCPARKVNKNFHGASLLKDPVLTREIIQAVKERISVPLSVKTRLGWSQKEEIFRFAKILEKSGIDALVVHGRTKVQEYRGKADWQVFGELKKEINIPLLASGDMFDPQDMVQLLEKSNLDGVMIARGAMGKPWIFNQIKALLNGQPIQIPASKEINQIVLNHARLIAEEADDLKEFRKHLIHYYKGFSGAKELRQNLLKVLTLQDLLQALNT